MTDSSNAIARSSVRQETPSLWINLLRRWSDRIRYGRCDVILPDGRKASLGGAHEGPHARVVLEDWSPVRRLLADGGVGFAEAYIDGKWSSPDLPRLIEFAARNRTNLSGPLGGNMLRRMIRGFRHRLRPNTRGGSRRNIAFHYDLGNEFYERWLDRSMTYSSAVFTSGTEDLEAAQEQKYRCLSELLDVRRGHRVLEIGCGWGGLADHLGRTTDAKIDAVTISRAQHAYARERIARTGLDDRIDIRLQDYRDVPETTSGGGYDRIASIEMFEAVGEAYWPTFFRKLRRCLADDGVAALQVITIREDLFETYRKNADFIQTHVFPGGMLPSPERLRHAAAEVGLRIDRMEGYGLHYAETLARWRERFLAGWEEIAALGHDERFRRYWEFYLAYCEGGFRAGNIDVKQIRLVPA